MADDPKTGGLKGPALAALARRTSGTADSPLSQAFEPDPRKVDKKRVADWLNEKWKGDFKCPISQHTSWFIADDLIHLSSFYAGPTPPVAYASVAIICQGCGYTMFFNHGVIIHPEVARDAK